MDTAKSQNGSKRDVVKRFGHDRVVGIHSLTQEIKDNNGKKTVNKIEGWDEMKGEYSNNKGKVLYPSDFIKTSNNFYFGTMLMLGAYSGSKLKNGLGEVLEASTAEASIFPKIGFGTRRENPKKKRPTMRTPRRRL